MSLILDALNRAEQERKRQDQVPDIHTIHLSPAMSLGKAARTRRRLLIAGGLLLLILIVGLVIWLMRPTKPALPDQPAVAQVPSSTVTTSAVNTSASAPVQQAPAPQATAPQTESTGQQISSVTAEQTAAAAPNADINSLYAKDSDAENAASSVPSPVADLYQEKIPEQSESVSTPFPQTESMRDLPPGRIRSLDEFPNLPFFNDLPWNQKQQIPTISYSRHNYLPNAVSSVVINGATRGIGNLAPGEFIVEDIVSDGVVLRHQDKVFKLPALSGWVNM